MQKDKNIFTTIIKNTIFAFLKEKYPHYEIKDGDDNKNIIQIINILLELEKYAHIPNKKKLIEQEYNNIKSLMTTNNFDEELFLESLKSDTKDLSVEQREYILNTTVFVIKKDNKISDIEKEVLLQISRFLDIPHGYKEILSNYKKSEFVGERQPILIIVLGVITLALIATGIFWKLTHLPKIELFNTNKYQFDEIHFNRYIMYKNRFDIGNKHFKKYAVYYISGIATVSFNPKNLVYDKPSKTVILTQKSFDIDVNIPSKNRLEIDRVQPESITDKEASSIGAVVGLAGAYGGAKLGSKLTTFFPPNIKASVMAGSALVGGATGYFVTTNLLENSALTKDISQTDKENSFKIGKQLVKAQLQVDKKLIEMYEEHFKTFIKAKYRTFDMPVDSVKIVYQEGEK